MFDRLIHSDWSTDPRKKWMAVAECTPQGWQVAAPRRVPDPPEFIDCWLFGGRTVLAGFDFPIGVPVAYGNKTEFNSFPDALQGFGSGDWKEFFAVAERPEDISFGRPFYPRAYQPGYRQAELLRALGVETADQLRRACERKTANRRAACPLFWTLGGNQVGKAAIDGWQSVIVPALLRGARLWPFDGRLGELSKVSRCVLCETYPQEAYGHIGIEFRAGESKRTQAIRRRAADAIIPWAEEHGVIFEAEALEALLDGFGSAESGEDPFDAFAGLLSMIEVVDGRREEGNAPGRDESLWEGWILGQRNSVLA